MTVVLCTDVFGFGVTGCASVSKTDLRALFGVCADVVDDPFLAFTVTEDATDAAVPAKTC